MEVNAEEANDEKGNNFSEPDPEPGQRSPRDAQKKKEKKENRRGTTSYCWFSHDVTKIQTKKLSILPRFYFHDALEQLKTNFHTGFRFKRVLGFVIEYA